MLLHVNLNQGVIERMSIKPQCNPAIIEKKNLYGTGLDLNQLLIFRLMMTCNVSVFLKQYRSN